MFVNRIAIAALAVILWAPVHNTVRASSMPQYPGQDRGWDAPPAELQDVQRLGFHDGIIGAQKDFDNHRRPDPNNRDEYRRPDLPPGQWDAYRDGFRRGYQRAVEHMMGPSQPPMPPPGYNQPGPPRPPMGPPPGMGPGSQIRMQGFQDGMVGALKDLDNHRRPDPNNRDEYRHPAIAFQLQGAYRDAFRDGYSRSMAILTAGPERDDRFAGPGMEMRRLGFHDGADGAIRDFENNRPPDPNNRDEYRRPPNVPYPLQDAYRDGFRRGYQRVASELSGYQGRDWR